MARILVSLNVGRPRPLRHAGGEVLSAIRKAPVDGERALGRLGLDGDAQADRAVHGGVDKALCVYPREHASWWARELGIELLPGGAGDNLSTRGLLEQEVVIGDLYRVGASAGDRPGPLVQVSHPRQPCYKLAAVHGDPQIALAVQEAGVTGFYLRCLEPGRLRAGDPIELVERPAHGVTVAESNRVMHRDRDDVAGLRRLLAAPELAKSWRATFERRLGGELEDIGPRVTPPGAR
ncbi:MAG: MOSC domain-containing protein [Chloroflexi bacterium]|nr:MOSC domain-containing protein [Chloroflexota bacterium]